MNPLYLLFIAWFIFLKILPLTRQMRGALMGMGWVLMAYEIYYLHTTIR